MCFILERSNIFFEFKQSVNHSSTSGYNVDSAKTYKTPIAMLTGMADVKSKFEFYLNYFNNGDSCCESEVIRIRFEFVK